MSTTVHALKCSQTRPLCPTTTRARATPPGLPPQLAHISMARPPCSVCLSSCISRLSHTSILGKMRRIFVYASPITTSTTRCPRSTKSYFCRLRTHNSSESDGFLLAGIVFAYGGPSCSRRTRDLRVDGKSPTELHLGCGSVSHSPAVARHAMRWTTSIHPVLLPSFCSQCKVL